MIWEPDMHRAKNQVLKRWWRLATANIVTVTDDNRFLFRRLHVELAAADGDRLVTLAIFSLQLLRRTA